MTHVKATMKAHKGKPLSEVLKIAGKTYHKSKPTRKHRGGGEALYGFGAPTPEYPGGSTLADGVTGASDASALASHSYAPLSSKTGGMLQKAGRRTRRAGRKSRKASRRR